MYTFKELMALPLEDGEDEWLKYRAIKRRRGVFGGNGEGGPIGESVEEVDEALSLAARLKKSRTMKKFAARRHVGARRAMNRAADPSRLKKRAFKQARLQFFKKLSKGKSPTELTPQRRAEIEKRLDKMKGRIQKIAMRMIPQKRQQDKERRRSKDVEDK